MRPSASSLRGPSFFLRQLPQDAGDLLELRGLVEEIFSAGRQALLPILVVRMVGENQNMNVRPNGTKGAKNIEARAPGQVKIEHQGIRRRFEQALDRLRHIGGMTDKLHSRNVLQKQGEPFYDYAGIIDDEYSHSLPASKTVRPRIANYKIARNDIGCAPEVVVGLCEEGLTVTVPPGVRTAST